MSKPGHIPLVSQISHGGLSRPHSEHPPAPGAGTLWRTSWVPGASLAEIPSLESRGHGNSGQGQSWHRPRPRLRGHGEGEPRNPPGMLRVDSLWEAASFRDLSHRQARGLLQQEGWKRGSCGNLPSSVPRAHELRLSWDQHRALPPSQSWESMERWECILPLPTAYPSTPSPPKVVFQLDLCSRHSRLSPGKLQEQGERGWSCGNLGGCSGHPPLPSKAGGPRERDGKVMEGKRWKSDGEVMEKQAGILLLTAHPSPPQSSPRTHLFPGTPCRTRGPAGSCTPR